MHLQMILIQIVLRLHITQYTFLPVTQCTNLAKETHILTMLTVASSMFYPHMLLKN